MTTPVTKTYAVPHFKALPDEGDKKGQFEAVVSVFENVDLQGDRVKAGAFATNIKDWQANGDPIPVIWSHEWNNPSAHIGFVDPKNIHEVLPAKAKAKGVPPGLYVKGQLDVHKAFAGQIYDLMRERRIKEFSFAYDIVQEKVAKDGANDLIELRIIEVGPTLKGANPDTVSLGVKAALQSGALADKEERTVSPQETRIIDLAKRADDLGDPELAKMALTALGTDDGPESKAVEAIDGTKNFYGALAGSIEERRAQAGAAFASWMDETYPADSTGTREAYGSLVATFEDNLVAAIESADGIAYLEFPLEEADGALSLGEPASVDLEVTVTAKSEEPAPEPTPEPKPAPGDRKERPEPDEKSEDDIRAVRQDAIKARLRMVAAECEGVTP